MKHVLFIMMALLAATSAQAVASVGDTCDQAVPFIGNNFTFDTTNNTDSGYPVEGHCVYMGAMSKDIWLRHVPSADGVLTLSTCDPDSFDSSIIVYQNPWGDCDQLIYVGCNGDAELTPECQAYHSEIDVVVTGGIEYLIRIGGYYEDYGGPGQVTRSSIEGSNPCHCPEDLDDDQDIGVNDLLSVIDQWGQPGGSADVDYDGQVGVLDVLAVLAAWGLCPQEYVINDCFELPIQAETMTNGIFAIHWSPQFDHAADTVIMFEELNAIRDDCLNNLGMMDPPNPEGCFYYNIYVHHGENDAYPNGWVNGQGTDPNNMPYLTLPAGLNTDRANTLHEGFHIFQYQASSPGFSTNDAGWYIETTAQWYMSHNMPGDVNAFIEAGAIVANPQIALWHGFGNGAPGDPEDWYYLVRQYGMHTLLYYLVDVAGVSSDLMTNGFYSGTELRPQEYLYANIGGETFRGYFADWAARNTGGLDYLTPEQVERALWEADYVGDPENAHPHVLELADNQIDDTWVYEPCSGGGGFGDSCLPPRGWAYNVIRITNSNASTYSFTLEGDETGSEGAASHFDARIVVMGEQGPQYTSVAMSDDLNGQGEVSVQPSDEEVFLVIVSTPEHFTGNQSYGYRVEIQRTLTPP